MVTIARLPNSDPVIEGVLNLRGKAVPVINLHRHFGLSQASYQVHTPIILVREGEQIIGFIADEVLEVLNFSLDSIISPNELLPPGLQDIPNLRGIIYDRNRVVLLIELDNLFQFNQGRLLVDAASHLPQSDSVTAQ